MRENLREDILKTAQKLFNEKGYRKTTMRDISSSLNISIGNLTYHFHKKEDIMMELLSRPSFLDDDIASDYKSLFKLFDDMLESLVVNEFFYVEDELSLVSPQFYKHNISTIQEIEDKLIKSFKNLEENKLLNWHSEDELKAITSFIMMSHTMWIKHCFYQRDYPITKKDFLYYHYQLLIRNIPNKEIANYQKILKDFKLKEA